MKPDSASFSPWVWSIFFRVPIFILDIFVRLTYITSFHKVFLVIYNLYVCQLKCPSYFPTGNNSRIEVVNTAIIIKLSNNPACGIIVHVMNLKCTYILASFKSYIFVYFWLYLNIHKYTQLSYSTKTYPSLVFIIFLLSIDLSYLCGGNIGFCFPLL